MAVFAQFVPLLTIPIIQGLLAWPIVKRKGLGIGFFVLCLVPSLGILAIIWMASMTDKAVLDELLELRELAENAKSAE